MPSLDEIYARHGDRYERLVSREDHEGNIPAVIREIRPPEGLDYRFGSVAEAEELTEFFFGTSLVERLISTKPVILPECTGVWSASH